MDSPIRFSRFLPGFIGLVFALAACGTDGTAGCPDSAPSPLPAGPHADDPELADRIPDEVGGQPLEVQTVCATKSELSGLTTSPRMLDEVGVELQDVTIAVTPAPGGSSGAPAGVTAWRYAGAEEGTIRDAFLGMLEEAEIPVEHDTIGGKEIDRAVFHVYYVAGDTLYAVLGEDEHVEEVMQALP